MNLRAILIKVWQRQPLKIEEIIFLIGLADPATLAEVLEFCDASKGIGRITVDKAEKELDHHAVC